VSALLKSVIDAAQDFEWYPTTDDMIAAVARRLPRSFDSLMDIGAGDGRVLAALAQRAEHAPQLYAIEKSPLLMQSQPENVTPLGVDFYEQNLACLPVDFIFSNPPYSDFETWAARIIEFGYAKRAYLVIPQRWRDSREIAAALERRKATAKVIYSGDFLNAERRARAVVDIIEVSFPTTGGYRDEPVDPFDIWFDENIGTFETEREVSDGPTSTELARLRRLRSIAEMVAAFDEDYARMESNYRAIFALDHELLRELSVSKDKLRTGIKARMSGLKTQYWQLLFEKLDAITNRLSTATKKRFIERLTGRTAVAFTLPNATAIVVWAIQHANRYFDAQVVDLFKALATFDGVQNYKSNQRTWQKSGWRYCSDDFDHFALDYRIVVSKYQAIFKSDFGRFEYPGDLHSNCHELLDDIIAVMSNLGFMLDAHETRSRNRQWHSGSWQDFVMSDGRVLFQAKAFMNGNMHFRFMPEAIRALNVEAGRLLGWLKDPSDVVRELGYSADEAQALFGSNRQMTAGNLRLLLTSGDSE
jgi:hypothetical protein